MKWLIRNSVLVALSLLVCVGTSRAQSSSRGAAQPQPIQVQGQPIYQAQPTYQPYQQPNTFIPNETVVNPGSGTRVESPGSGTRVESAGSGTRVESAGSGTRQSVMSGGESFEQKFWNYLVRSKYRNWAPVPGKSDKMYEGESPHGAYLKMYLNRTAAGNVSDLPTGSIVIKENYGKDQRTLMAVTVMYKNNGYSPSTGDWYWVKYNPDGTVASKNTDKGPMSLAGRVQGCIDCHDSADGDDYAFFND